MITQSAVARQPDFKGHLRRFAKYTPPRRASCVDSPRQTCRWRSKFTWLAKYADRRRVSTEGFTPKCRPPAHRSDESPAGYSSASCSAAELASASPAEHHLEREEET